MANVANLGRMKTYDKMTALLLSTDKEWHFDQTAYNGNRYRRWPSWGPDELLAYESGRWEIRQGSANGQTTAEGKEDTLDHAKERVILVYVAMLLPCEGLTPNEKKEGRDGQQG